MEKKKENARFSLKEGTFQRKKKNACKEKKKKGGSDF